MNDQDNMSEETFLSYLQKVFNQRKKNNPAYSIRAFARQLGMDQSLLSKFLRGKTDLHWDTIEQCLSKLNASDEVKQLFKRNKFNFSSDFNQLEESILNMMASWKYWAILEYLKIDPSPTEATLSERFHFELQEVNEILSSLTQLGFIEAVNGKYRILKPNNSWIDNVKTSKARRTFQKDIAHKSTLSIEDIPIDKRHHCSLTVSVDRKRIPEIKEKITTLMVELGKYMQKNNEANEVYQVSLGFFPLTVQEANEI